MSTFNGFFDEIPFISADSFEDHNLESKLFFLSHCHADHMKGLLKNCESLPGPIYTSPISAMFLKKQFPLLQNIEVLKIESPTQLTYTNDDKTYNLLVTSVSAKHCPGSVMFIFETESTKILYTGDFRLSKELIEKTSLLSGQHFNKIYMDSTFLDVNYSDFPSQLESINGICKLIEDWTINGKEYKVILEMAAQYGYEYLFVELSRKLKKKLYIEDKQLEKYIYFPSMDNCFGRTIEESHIIIVQKYNKNFFPNGKFRTIKPTALYWSNWNKFKPFFVHEGNEVYRIAYSNHSSLNEIKDFLQLVKTNAVSLNVQPNDLGKKYLMQALLEQIISKNTPKPTSTNRPVLFKKVLETSHFATVSRGDKAVCQLLPKRRKL